MKEERGGCMKQSRGGVLKSSEKFTGKRLCWSLLLYKVARLLFATLLKKELQHRCFPVNFAKFWRTCVFIEHFQWLLLGCGSFYIWRVTECQIWWKWQKSVETFKRALLRHIVTEKKVTRSWNFHRICQLFRKGVTLIML